MKVDVKKIVRRVVDGPRSEEDFKSRFGATDEGASFKTASGKDIPVVDGKLQRHKVK